MVIRYRIVGASGKSFVARKGQTYSELQSWKRAYNRHNKDKVQAIIKEEYTKRKTRPRNPYSLF